MEIAIHHQKSNDRNQFSRIQSVARQIHAGRPHNHNMIKPREILCTYLESMSVPIEMVRTPCSAARLLNAVEVVRSTAVKVMVIDDA